ncbi:MAG: FAD:protein FMN transferase [Cellvibrionaceae bacterium]|nr:FAD:protein FMN transferase [Cellvibrionaceae bacterium]
MLFFLVVTSSANAEWYSDTQAIMGTEVSLTFWHEDKNLAARALADTMAEMRRIDRQLSPYKEDSELSIVNRQAAKSPQRLSRELLYLVDKSLYFSGISEGAFDITFASLGWFYNYREKKQPSEGQRSSLLPAVNYQLLKLDKSDGSLFYQHENIRIDLGGIAKGYAVDRAVNLLSALGVTQATVSAGGDSRVLGDKFGKQWLIGIKNPRGSKGEAAIVLPLSNTAVSTSGDYERYFIDEASGERVHHILNPRTGKPTRSVASVTVLGPQGADTDPLSTSVFVLGVERGLALINKLDNFDCIIIDLAGKVHYSQGLMPPNS